MFFEKAKLRKKLFFALFWGIFIFYRDAVKKHCFDAEKYC